MLASLPFLLSCASASVVGVAKRDTALFPIGGQIIQEIEGAIDDTIHLPGVNNTAILDDIKKTIDAELNILKSPLEDLSGSYIGKVIQKATESVGSKIFGLTDELTKKIEAGLEDLVGKTIPFPVAPL